MRYFKRFLLFLTILFGFIGVTNAWLVQVGSNSYDGIIQDWGINNWDSVLFDVVTRYDQFIWNAFYWYKYYNLDGTEYSFYNPFQDDYYGAVHYGNEWFVNKTINFNNGKYLQIFTSTYHFSMFWFDSNTKNNVNYSNSNFWINENYWSLGLFDIDNNGNVYFGAKMDNNLVYYDHVNNDFITINDFFSSWVDEVYSFSNNGNTEYNFSDYYEFNFIWWVLVAKDSLNTLNFWAVSDSTGLMTLFSSVTSDLFTDSRIFINNFDFWDSSLYMTFSVMGDNTYSIYVPFYEWGIVEETNMEENVFLAWLSWDLYFYDSNNMQNIKSNKDFVWLWLTTINNNKFVTWFDEVDGVWYIDDNNAGVVTVPDDGSLFPDRQNPENWWGTGWDTGWDTWDIPGLVDIVKNIGLFIYDGVIYVKDSITWLIDSIKDFLDKFNNFFSTDTVDLTSFFISKTYASDMSDSLDINTTNAPKIITNISSIWLSVLILVLIFLSLGLILYFIKWE